jgi:hypothetical protein
MNAKISIGKEIYEKCPPNYGFPAKHALEVIERPDQPHDIRFADLTVRLYYKFDNNRGDLVGVVEEAAAFAIHVFPDLCETALKDLAPLDVLQAFVRRFGLDITIGDKTDKLFLMETVPLIAPVKRIKLLTIANPEVHSYVGGCASTAKS